jgi:hypothetical protein
MKVPSSEELFARAKAHGVPLDETLEHKEQHEDSKVYMRRYDTLPRWRRDNVKENLQEE